MGVWSSGAGLEQDAILSQGGRGDRRCVLQKKSVLISLSGVTTVCFTASLTLIS